MYEESSDQLHNDDDLDSQAMDSLGEGHEIEQEDGHDSGVQDGERSEGSKSGNHVDFEKIPDESLRHQVKSRIGELYRKSLEGEQAKAKLQKLQSELEAMKQQKELVVVDAPDVELAIDDPKRFAEQQKAHAEYLAKKYQHESAQQAKAQQLEEESKKAQQERVDAYNKRVRESGIDQQLLGAAANQIAAAGISDDLAGYLLDHENGPGIVQYLGTNFEELYKVSQMSPMKAVAYIEAAISPKAGKKKTPSAPPPNTKVSGARISDNGSKPDRRYM